MSIPLTVDNALENRDALAKALYTKLFDSLIADLNQQLLTKEVETKDCLFVGLLDIYGFENFQQNRFGDSFPC